MRGGKLITTLLIGVIVVLSFGYTSAAQADDTRITDGSVTVALSSTVASATGVTATVNFTTNTFMFDASVIAITLSSNSGTFNLDNVVNSSITSSSLTGSGSTQTAGSSKILLFTTSAFAAAGTQTITISGITNPAAAGTATLTVTTQGTSGLSSGLTETATTSITGGSGGGDEGDSGGFGDEDSGDFGGGSDAVTGDNTVTVTVTDENGTAVSGEIVYGYCGMSYSTATTILDGTAELLNMANGNCGVWLSSSEYYAETRYFTFASTTEAKTEGVTLTASALDTNVALTVTNPDGSAAESIYVYMTDSAGREFSGATDSAGQVEFGVFYGTYIINGYIGSSETAYYLPETTVTLSASGVSTDGNTNEIAIQLAEYTSFITGTITSAATGAVIDAPRTLVYSSASMRFMFGESDGTYSVGVIPGTYTVKAESTGYANTALKNIVVSAGETVANQDIALPAADNSLNITTVDVDGNAVAESGYVFCKPPEALYEPSEMYFGFMEDGAVSFTLPDGDFQCLANVTGYVSAAPTFTMAGAETEAGEIILSAYNATLTVNLVDQDGNALNNVRFGVFGESPDGTSLSGYSMGGAVDVGALAGTYTLRAYVMGGGYATDYNNPTQITLADGDSESVTLTVYETAGTISGVVTNADDNAVSGAAVKATCTTNSGKSFEFKTTTDTAGAYALDTVNGKCVLNSAVEDGSNLPSGDESVTMSGGTDIDHDLQLQDSTATLKVTPTATATSGIAAVDVESGSCYAYNADGVYVTADINDDTGKASLPVLAGDWSYGCRVVSDDKVKVSADDVVATVQSGDTESVNAAVASADDNFDNLVVQFSATSDSTFSLPDGTEVFVPANALDNTGNVTITASMTTDIASQDGLAAGPAIELTARDSNNRQITGSFNGDITIKFAYTPTMLEKYGLSEADLSGGYTYNDGALAVTDQGYTIDTENNTVTVTTDHFSTFAIAGVKAVAPSTAKSLKAKKITASTAKLTWKAPSIGEVTKYKVQLRKHGVKKTSKWTKYKNVTTLQKKLKDLKADTRYQFRVKACNTKGCSAYTKWKAFKTKL